MGKDKKTSGLREDDKTSQMFLVECCRNNLLKALCEMMSTPDKMIRQKFLEAQYYQHPSIPLPIYLLWVAHSSDSRSVSDFLKDTFQHCMTEQERNDPGSAILLLASSTGDVEVAELLLDAEVSPDCHDEFGRSALHVASQEGHCRCVSVLLEKGADIDFCDKTGHTALHYACNAKRDDIVKVLCEAGADPNLADVNGYTPLHLSSMRGNAECIKDLHAAKADLGKTNERGRTPLHYTCMRGYADCTKVLCKAKANLDCTDKYDMTPVDYVVTRKRGDAMMTLQIVLSFMVTMLEAFTCLSLLVKAREMTEEEEESAALQNTIIKCISKVPYNVKDDSLFVPLYALTEEHFCQLLRASLRRYQLHPLLLEAFMRRRMKNRVHHSPLVVRLLGPPGGGKTSLVMSLLRIRTIWMRIVNYFSGDQGDSILTARTKGIQRSNSPDESIVYLDLGGQYRYMASHQWLTGYSDVPVLNILTVSSVASKEEVRRQLRQWCDFIACRVKAGVANKSKLLIVATRRDSSTKAQRDVISAEVKLLKKVLKDHFEFQDPSVLFVNAIDQECFGVANLREAISKVKDEVTQGMQGDVPFAEYYLDNVRSQANQALTVSKSEFTKCLVKAVLSPDFVLDSRSVQLAISSMQRIIDIEKSLYDLHKTAKLFYFPRTQSGVAKPRDIDDGLVVLEPVWLMSDITKKLYSPPDYLPLFITCDKVGFAKRDEVEQVLGHDSLISGREALNIAHKLGMCHITDDGVQVMIMPGQAENRASCHWPAPIKGVHRFYSGRRLYCKSGIAMSAALLPAIQMAMVNKYASCGMKFPVWQGGIRVSAVEYEHTETLIEVPYGQVALNIITRGPNQANVCEQQQEIWHHIQTLSLRISPGSELEPVFVDDDCLSSSRQLQGLDIKGELNAGLAFFASDHLRSQCPLPPAAYADVGERPDVRLLHRYCKGASCENAGTSEERDRAKRYCSALYKHRLLIASDFPFDECLIKLAHVHEVNTSFQFEFSEFVKQDGPKAAADLFCEAIYNLPDTVVLSLAKKVLPALNAPKARDLHYVFLHCLGHAKCDEEHHTPPSEVNKMPSRSNNSTIGSPFDTKLFCVDLQPWILGVETTHFRETAQRAGLLTTTEVDDLCWMEGNRPPSQHNQELLRILKLERRRGYVALCGLVRDMGKFDGKLQLMNSLLQPGERV